MPNYLAPGVYMEELSSGNRPIAPVSTSVAAFIGVAQKGPVNAATRVTNFSEFVKLFGGPLRIIAGTQEHYLYYMVRHFFEQGGGRCYVVRVIPNLAAAVASSMTFDGVRLDKTVPATVAVADALEIAAANPGGWGGDLAVRLTNTSPYSVLLAGDAAAADDVLLLQENTDVRVGALLWIVAEVTGTVTAVDVLTSTVTIEAGMTELSTVPAVPAPAFSGSITDGMTVFGTELQFLAQTSLDAPILVDPADDTVLVLSGLNKVDGSQLRAGDSLTFAIVEELVVVERVSQMLQVSPESPDEPIVRTLAHFAPGLLNAFTAQGSRVYARDFSLEVRLGEDIVETHEHLSLVNADQANHVGERLGSDGDSFYIVAIDGAAALDDVEFDNSDFVALANGADGLTDGDLDLAIIGDDLARTGLHALDTVLDASILCIPNASQVVSLDAIGYVENRKDMFYVFEQPSDSDTDIAAYRRNFGSEYAAIYHPWILVTDRLTGRSVEVPPCGAVAGVYAKTDGLRGVHKAPAGLATAKVTVAQALAKTISKGDYDELYPAGINALRRIADAGFHVWGGRTISPDPEWRYVNVRRLFIMLEQSILRATSWATFEPNDQTLWKTLEGVVSAFLRIQWREGKLVGDTEQQAFFVKCDEETNPPEVVDAGQVITLIGAAPSKPAEFVIFRIQQLAGQTAS
jgi:phage tail sheath protein FI